MSYIKRPWKWEDDKFISIGCEEFINVFSSDNQKVTASYMYEAFKASREEYTVELNKNKEVK